MDSKQALNTLIDSLQAEQDELTLQKNYLSEAGRILSSDTLKESYQALVNCMQDYPAYLFKKEKEFIFFVTKINSILDVFSDEVTNFSDPNIQIELGDLTYKMSFYYTVQGICEINFEYDHTDTAIQMKLDALNHQLIISAQDVLHLNLQAKVKSYIIHYIANVASLLETIGFDVIHESTTNIDPFLMFKHFEFEKAPRLDDSDLDRLFISMDGKGDMRYTDDQRGVILTLDEHNTVWVTTVPGSLTSTVKMENNQGEIYLFDLLGDNPFLEMLFEGEIRIKKDHHEDEVSEEE